MQMMGTLPRHAINYFMSSPRVLLVEDNPIDARMIKRALKIGGLFEEPHVVNDGAPAIALLARDEAYRHIPLPDLVLLDLNLIRVDGDQVLRYIRQTPELEQVCVAILSSTSPDDVRSLEAAEAQPDGFFMKPSDLVAYESLGSQILACYQNSKRRVSLNPLVT